MSLPTMIAPDRRNIVEPHCVAPRPFQTPFPNGVEAQPSIVDGGGLGLSFKPLDNHTGKELSARKDGRRHGHGGGCIQNH